MTVAVFAQDYSVGVYYYPGWWSDSSKWRDLKGMPGSLSPGKPWPEREPLLSYYPEDQPWVAVKHIEWASQYGINFFAYDWYWDGKQPQYEHALKNYLKAVNRRKVQFCILWANHFAEPNNLKEFDDMVMYWVNNYFDQPSYYRIENKPVVFIFSINQLDTNAGKFGESATTLLVRANAKSKEKGFQGIYFIAATNDRPDYFTVMGLFAKGLNAYTGWNYVMSKGPRVADYDVMVDGYLDYYAAAAGTINKIPYIVPASPGWDSRPWDGNNAWVRSNSTPEKFTRMLSGAKTLLDNPKTTHKILMIEAWNEFGEGSYIEPTRKWGYAYLEAIKKIFTSPTATTMTK